MQNKSPKFSELTVIQRLGYIAGCGAAVAVSVFLILAEVWIGWIGVGLFGLCMVLYILQPWLPKSRPAKKYRAIITEDSVQCEYPKSGLQSMRWDEITRVVLATTSDGPWLPDRWLFFFNADGGELPVPTEAEGFDQFFDVLESRLPGFDFEPFIAARADDALYECWSQDAASFGGK